jgi:hypothetical protein
MAQGEAGALAPDKTSGVRTRAVKVLRDIANRDPAGTTGRYLRKLFPFALDGAHIMNLPFFLIEDPSLIRDSVIDSKLWKGTEQTAPANWNVLNSGGEPLIVHLGAPGPDDRIRLPQEYICESRRDPSYPPAICWNSAKDLSPSKLLHVSNQAFYLRRYARRVAALWQHDYGRRPAINAFTSMALNGRPHQPLVRPDADLASVSASWFRHNDWIFDLQTPRIPREALKKRWEGAE